MAEIKSLPCTGDGTKVLDYRFPHRGTALAAVVPPQARESYPDMPTNPGDEVVRDPVDCTDMERKAPAALGHFDQLDLIPTLVDVVDDTYIDKLRATGIDVIGTIPPPSDVSVAH